MLQVTFTILPIFVIILLGWGLRSRDFLPGHLLGPLNRLVYYLAIPAMIFRSVAQASFEKHFEALVATGALLPLAGGFLAGWLLAAATGIPRQDRGTFMQCCFHGNLGYIGLAVAFYFLGSAGFTQASILAAFLMLLQNFLAVVGLQLHAPGAGRSHPIWFFLKKIFGNPVIFSALAGIVFSLAKIPLPGPVDRSLDILSGMALPLALLVIGRSLSFGIIRSHLRTAALSAGIKLLLLPAMGIGLYSLFDIPTAQSLPGVILLAAPTATVTYVMAAEMEGSPDLASAAVSLNTLLSALGFIFWLGLLA